MFEKLKSRLRFWFRLKPSQRWLYDLGLPEYTRDLRRLQRNEFHYLFEPGELMSSCLHHRMLHSTPICSIAFTEDKYAFVVGHNSFCIPLQGRFPTRLVNELMVPARLRGELYLVSTSTLLELDKYRKNGVKFVRKRVPLIVPDNSYEPFKQMEPSTQTAWMYVGTANIWRRKIDWDLHYFYHSNGRDYKPVSVFHNKHIGSYYHFINEQQINKKRSMS